MVRFKTRWLLLAIDTNPLSTSSPFASSVDDQAHASTSYSILSSAQQARPNNTAALLTPQHITRLLRASLAYNFGDVAAGAFGGVLTCKYYSSHTGTAIIRCSRDAARLVWAAATLVSSPVEVGTQEKSEGSATLRMRVVHCGGTIKKVQNKAIELDRKMILRMRAKQKRLAAESKASSGLARAASNTPLLEEKASIPATIPIAAVDDDEDLGEALDPDVSEPDPAASTVDGAAAAKGNVKDNDNDKASASSTADHETQALLAHSRKQINSISI